MTNKNKLSRREAIKLLGAAAGASVLANLPSKWSRPAVSSGAPPAFAQTSELTVFAPCAFYNNIPINQPINACAHVIFTATANPNVNVNYNLASSANLLVNTPVIPNFPSGTVMSNTLGAVSLVTEVMFIQTDNAFISNQFTGPGVICAQATVNFIVPDVT